MNLSKAQSKEIHFAVNSVSSTIEQLTKHLIILKGHLLCFNQSEGTKAQQEIEVYCADLARESIKLKQVFERNVGDLSKENVTLVREADPKLDGAFRKLEVLRKEFKEQKAIVEYTMQKTKAFLDKTQSNINTELSKSGIPAPVPKQNKGRFKRRGLV